jgi:hypothetical protein
MPVTIVTAPDGTEYDVTHPEGASDYEIKAYAKKMAAEEAKEGGFGDRAREAAAGLTFEFGDEIEGGIRSLIPGSGTYEEERDKVRAQMSEFRENNPYTALGYNVAGSLPTMLIPGLGMAKGAQGIGQLAKAGAKLGLAEGLLSGAGATEAELRPWEATTDDVGRAAIDIGVGGAVGTAAGGLLGGGTSYLGNKLTKKGADAINGMPPTAVAAELKEIGEALGMTTDDLVRQVNQGKLVAEMPELANLVNAYQGAGKQSRSMVQGVYGGPEGRGARLNREAQEEVFNTLTDGADQNQLLAMQRRAGEIKEGSGPIYQAANKQEITDPEFIAEMERMYRMYPDLRAEVEQIARESGHVIQFKGKGANGAVDRYSPPTVGEADRLMRGLRELKGRRYREGQGQLGEAAGNNYKGFRGQLDELSPELAGARRQAREANLLEEGFKDFDSNPGADFTQRERTLRNQREMLSGNGESDLMPSYMEGARAGASKQISNALRNMSENGSAAVKKFLEDGSNQNMLLRMVAEGRDIGPLLRKLDQTASARTAQQKLLNPSATAGIQAATKNMGAAATGADMLQAMTAQPEAIIRLTAKVSDALKRRIKPEEIDEVVKVLLSDDPELIRRAFSGEGEKAAISKAVLEQVQQLMQIGVNKAVQDTTTAGLREYQ